MPAERVDNWSQSWTGPESLTPFNPDIAIGKRLWWLGFEIKWYQANKEDHCAHLFQEAGGDGVLGTEHGDPHVLSAKEMVRCLETLHEPASSNLSCAENHLHVANWIAAMLDFSPVLYSVVCSRFTMSTGKKQRSSVCQDCRTHQTEKWLR
jgi:hypothetical protein